LPVIREEPAVPPSTFSVSPDLIEGAYIGQSSTFHVNLNDDTIYQALDKSRAYDFEEMGLTPDFGAVCIKCLMYILSKDADITPTVVDRPLTKKPKKIRRWERDNETLDHRVVGYSFHGRHRHVTEGYKRGHFKKVGVGPGKLVREYRWWGGHDISYKNPLPDKRSDKPS